MKIIYILLLILTFGALISCSSSKKEDHELFLKPRENIEAIMDSFVVFSKDKSLIYEIYIDKITPWEYDIILYSGKVSLSENATVVAKTIVSDVKFNIYSGIEHYFCLAKDSAFIFDDDPREEGAPLGNYWIIIDRKGKVEVMKNSWALPFYSMPNRQNLLPAEINGN